MKFYFEKLLKAKLILVKKILVLNSLKNIRNTILEY